MNDRDYGLSKDPGIEGMTVWRKAVDLTVDICRNVLPAFPNHERFALTNQLRRSIQSIPANIAEGHGRYYYQDAIRFCYIARGSLEEARTQITLASRLNYLDQDIYVQLESRLVEIRSLLNGYIAYLKRIKRGAGEPGSSINELPEIYSVNSTGEDRDRSSLPHNSEHFDTELE